MCAGPGRLAIAEAKGSSQAPNATGRGMPEPIKTGADQIQGVVVEKLRRVKAKERWTPIRAKGWAVMSRWDVEKPSIDAFLYVPDPNN